MKIVRFKGKFKDLIPNGWTFQKLYARNYRQYHKTCDGNQYRQGCRIWQHHGGYLEIDDLNDPLHAIFVEKIISGKIDEWATMLKSNEFKNQIVYWFIIDQDENRFIPYNSPEYKEIRRKEYALSATDGIDKIDAHYERYRSWNTGKELIDMLSLLIHMEWITVEELPEDSR